MSRRGARDTRKNAVALIVGTVLVGLAAPLRAEWNSTNADSRYRIERTGDAGARSDTGYVLLWPNDRPAGNTCVEVFSTNGLPVGCRILWAEEGEPLKILFDASQRNDVYYVYTGPGPARLPAWEPRAGVVLETRIRQTGEPTNAAAIRRICMASAPVLGRSLIPNVFLGIHPHGPTADFVSIIDGYLAVRKAGDYGFATISEDASCLLVDGKVIADWPGWHGCHEGRRGQHQGTIALAAGIHRLEYFNVKMGGGYIVEAAWRPPGQDRFDVIPADAFVPVVPFSVLSYEAAPSTPRGARFAWEITGHFTIDVATLVHVRFRALGDNQRCTWKFDDGTRQQGSVVEHVFLSPGLRPVKLETEGQGGPATVSQIVSVHPLWTQEKDQPRHLFKEERRRLEREDLRSAPVADIVGVYRIAADEQDLSMAKRFAALCLQRKADFTSDYAKVFCEMALFVQRSDLQEYGIAEDAFRMVLESPLFSPEQKAWAGLHLSGLLIHYVGRVEGAQELLGRIDSAKLSDVDQRLKKIYEADALFAQGHVDLARAAYVSVGTSYAPGDTGLALKRQVRLETARDYLRRGEFDGAEQMVRCIEWDAPEQRMATETGLITIRVCLGRKEFLPALLLARKLLPVAETDIRRSELLFDVVEICLAVNRGPEATTAYRELLKDHPYSEAAARAKEAWGARMGPDTK